ncbi:timeless protein-domain-containing protein [Amylocystis lapponica]|nr:timeless protein-domain-containing protein [Amylocystis lapponica]
MNDDDAISISSGESDNEQFVDRRAILQPAVQSVVDALGGFESGTYRLGDECYGCLKDLKRLWRKDDTDDERTVARIFWETRVLPNDLVPILLETAGKGLVEDRCAIACADLMAAMTWPIDLAEELKELDEDADKGTDYTQLVYSHLHYKAALLRPGAMQALFGIMLPCLAKNAKERKERDVQIINVVLYLVRNLAFIKDLPANMHLSADQAAFSSLQSRLITALSETNTLDLLLTIASNAPTDSMFNGWNALVLEIFYLLFRGVKPASLAMDQAKQPAQHLQRLLAVEDKRKRDYARTATSRHSRFGTTLSVQLNPKKAQAAAGADADAGAARGVRAILDMAKRHRPQKGQRADELARADNLALDARVVLQTLARTFVEACFNPLLASLLKDIKAERAKIAEKDHLRLLYVATWFLEFFLCARARHGWDFGLVAEVTERAWIGWVLRRMREALDEKPKLWTEFQAGVECLTQLLVLVDGMCSAEGAGAGVADAAAVLQQQIIYNGEVLDLALESVRVYREGTQSLAYLDASVRLAHALFRMLERWGKARGAGGEMYVRRKAKARRRRKGKSEEDGVPDVEEEVEEEDEEVIHETMFTLDAFEAKFAHPDITQTLLAYLARYKEFGSSEDMKRVVSLMHRQAVRAKAEGLFFMVSTLDLFKSILADAKSLPRDQPYKDLVALINYILRKFFKAVEEDSFLVVEAFFPKNRGQWKHLSSWEPDAKGAKAEAAPLDTRFPPDVQVKKGYSWSEQLGIAIACLIEGDKMELVDWVKEILMFAIGQRQRIIEDTDGSASARIAVLNSDSDDAEDNAEVETLAAKRGPSNDALAKFSDHMIPYVSDEQANAATKDPHLKLVFRLVYFHVLDEDAEELEWYIPASILPSDLQSSLNVINQFIETPLDLEGKKASQMLQKKRRRRRRRRRAPSEDSEASEKEEDEEPKNKKKREKKEKEKQQYKSAQFIEDSDAEYGDMGAFLEKEKALRQRMAVAAAATGQVATMKPTGTKKRRRKAEDKGADKKRRKGGGKARPKAAAAKDSDKSGSDDSDLNIFGSPKASTSTARASPGDLEIPTARPRPRPRPRPRRPNPAPSDASSVGIATPEKPDSDVEEVVAGPPSTPPRQSSPDDDLDLSTHGPPPDKKKPRAQAIIISDEE